jgi:hypothetical protein
MQKKDIYNFGILKRCCIFVSSKGEEAQRVREGKPQEKPKEGSKPIPSAIVVMAMRYCKTNQEI